MRVSSPSNASLLLVKISAAALMMLSLIFSAVYIASSLLRRNGNTALMWAAFEGHTSVVSLLLRQSEHRALVNTKSK